MLEVLKSIIYGIVEGVTEWLPISSTGHMILLEKVMPLNLSDEFWDLFLVVIQLGAILAVIIFYWNRIWPFRLDGGVRVSRKKLKLWVKIIIATIPAAVVGVLWDDVFTRLFYNFVTVAIMLIIVGVVFIIVENWNRNRTPRVKSTDDITYLQALLIGVFQMVAAIFPGTSRSGATIIGGLMLGISRKAAAEFTFFLAIPAMVGGSLLKLVSYHGGLYATEIALLIVGMAVAFVVSIFIIRFLMNYIRNHDFKVFGWYRIALGALVLIVFFATR